MAGGSSNGVELACVAGSHWLPTSSRGTVRAERGIKDASTVKGVDL